MVQPQSPGQRGRRGPRTALIVGLVVGVVVLLGGGAFGVDAYAKSTICSSLEDDSPAGSGSSGTPEEPGGAPTDEEIAKLRDGADELRGYSRLLVFHGDLRSATNGLADDVDQMVELVSVTGAKSIPETKLAEIVTVAGAFNGHVRQAQRECGLPVTGIFGD